MLDITNHQENANQNQIEGRRRRGQQSITWLDGITDSMDMSLSKFQDIVKDMEVWHAAVHGVEELNAT